MHPIERPGGDWQRRAACAGADDPEIFFPDRTESPPPALAICAGCPVARDCRDDAFATGDTYGVRGGLTGPQRAAFAEGRASGGRRGSPSGLRLARRRRSA